MCVLLSALHQEGAPFLKNPCIFFFKKRHRCWKIQLSWPKEMYVFVVLFVCLLAFVCTIVCVFFHIIENNHLAVVTFSPCFVSFCFDLVVTKLVFWYFYSAIFVLSFSPCCFYCCDTKQFVLFLLLLQALVWFCSSVLGSFGLLVWLD